MNRKIFLCSLIFVCCLVYPVLAYNAIDPTRNIPNARVLGLGKAYLALADDTGAIYTNPAGLADAINWQVTTMSGKFLEEYQYLAFSGFYPTTYGVFGVGYAGTSIGGAYATTIEAGSDPNDPLYEFDLSQTVMEDRKSAILLSYANQAVNVPYLNAYPIAESFTFGASLKLFQTSITGDGIQAGQGDASGKELSLGMKYQPPQKWIKVAAAIQNVLTAGMGGKLVFGNGHEESFPAQVQVGAVLNVLGDQDALRKFAKQDVKVMLDMDYAPTIANYPTVWHLGAEWKPVDMLALRFGLDQDAGDDGTGKLGVYSDMSYGVGLYYQGLRFDYAYHTFAGAPNIDNHYFSLSYGLMPPPKKGDPILVNIPSDKLITFESSVVVSGNVVEQSIKTLTINGQPLKFNLKGDFTTQVDLNLGKNAIVLEGKNNRGDVVGSTKVRVLRLVTFPDVATNYWVAQPISLLSMENIITGYPDKSFKPQGNISRAEMCTLLMKTKLTYGPSKETRGDVVVFKDVDTRHWAFPYITQASKQRIVLGYPDNTFKPKDNINRAEGLAMIARFGKVTEEAYGNEFPDVSSKYWASRIIAGSYRAGLLQFMENRPFEAKQSLLRSETVEMLYRTGFVQGVLNNDLLNWESY